MEENPFGHSIKHVDPKERQEAIIDAEALLTEVRGTIVYMTITKSGEELRALRRKAVNIINRICELRNAYPFEPDAIGTRITEIRFLYRRIGYDHIRPTVFLPFIRIEPDAN